MMVQLYVALTATSHDRGSCVMSVSPLFPVGVFEDLVRAYLPDLHEKLANFGIVSMISLSWFLTLFIR